MHSAEDRLASEGFALVPGPFDTAGRACDVAGSLCRSAHKRGPWGRDAPPLAVLGDFVIPPPGAQSRDFQALHFDFGLPLDPYGARDVARFTALFIPLEVAAVAAQTRLIRLEKLLRQRRWPAPAELVCRFKRYGASHGAWEPQLGYSEGILARLVDAADDREPALPSVTEEPDFLCGTEFATADAERKFFAERGLILEDAETLVELRPGQLLVFDNLAWAHGRRGRRCPGELRQRIFGYRALPTSGQRAVRRKIIEAFGS